MATFAIKTYEQNDVEGMVALYNAETAYEPFIASLTPDRFVTLVAQKPYFDSTGLFVAVETGRVIGWAHGCVAAGTEPWMADQEPVPQIRMLLFPRHRLDVGHALAAAATDWLREASDMPILALHALAGYPFYRGLWLGSEPMGPMSMPHVQMALAAAEYRTTLESIFMTATLDSPPQRETAGIRIETTDAALDLPTMAASWAGFQPMQAAAMLDDARIGNIGWVLLPHLDTLATPCVNIWSLNMDEAQRRKGIASALISHALRQGHDAGARFASVGTQLRNEPAHAAYARFGFTPHTVMVGRVLSIATT